LFSFDIFNNLFTFLCPWHNKSIVTPLFHDKTNDHNVKCNGIYIIQFFWNFNWNFKQVTWTWNKFIFRFWNGKLYFNFEYFYFNIKVLISSLKILFQSKKLIFNYVNHYMNLILLIKFFKSKFWKLILELKNYYLNLQIDICILKTNIWILKMISEPENWYFNAKTWNSN
jgi:hypothetical protein